MKADILITRKQVLGYLFMPQVLPRLGGLIGSGFWHLAYFMALVFRAANILPANHKYLGARAVGTYGVRDVLGEAANHLVVTRKHMDQVILFAAILSGVVILIFQFGLLLISFLVNPASAAAGGSGLPSNYGEFFITQNPEEDIAFRMLDRVFGVKDMFNSKDADKIGQFHDALHSLFQVYSIGLLVIAVLIILYFVAAIIAETAESGTPFGKRFNHVWAPIRLVVAIGLLIPIGQGLNAAQWITLYSAKFGSGFATNGWIKFNEVLGNESIKLLGDPDTLVGKPEVPEMMHIAQFMMIVKTCQHATQEKHGRTIQAYLVKNPAEGEGQNMEEMASYEKALEYFNNGDILIRFGEKDGALYKEYKGYVYPYCGDLILQTTNLKEPGAMVMQEAYYKLIEDLWKGELLDLQTHAEGFTDAYAKIGGKAGDETYAPDENYKTESYNELYERLETAIQTAVDEQIESETWKEDQDKIAAWGWGGAGAWYNRVAQINGSLVAAIENVPRARYYPAVMEHIKEEKLQIDRDITASEVYKPLTAGDNPIDFEFLGDNHIAVTLYNVYKFWNDKSFRTDPLSTHSKLTGNAIIDAINMIFGTQGLFDMCKNADIHPLAQLSNVGKSIIEASIRNFGFSVATGIAGGMGAYLQPHIGAGLQAASGFFASVASVGILVGFILFYILPFLPFLYFFFAVGGWVKGLFEAMVGVPLWALAHLRIDGEGLPGDAAAAGYYLIFEVFIRPILIIFGLLASVAIFAGMVKILNDIFSLVVSNLSGFNPETAKACAKNVEGASPEVGSAEYFRGPVDEFFFTVIYAIIVYMIGMSSFKLIDLIPNNILRWMGTGVATFDDKGNEPADGLVQKVAVGGGLMSGQLQGAFGQLSSAVGGAGRGVAAGLAPPKEG